MKYSFLILILLFSAASVAQSDADQTDSQKRMTAFADAKRHEIALDVLAPIIPGIDAFSPRYEYVLNKTSGLGVDVSFRFADSDEDFDYQENFSITPYYRQYFFSKEDYGAKGFYGEGFVKAFTFQETFFVNNFVNPFTQIVEEDYFEVAVGVGIGWKWVSDSGFLIDLHFGLGRNLGLADVREDSPLEDVTGRGGLNFGWRF
jgi:hypothetical protein